MSEPFTIIGDTRELSREEWLSLRKTGIGGSDAGSIMGVSKWGSALSVWADKRGLLPEKEDNDDLAFGRRMEPVLREWFQDLLIDMGAETLVEEFPQMLRSTLYPHALVNLDGTIYVKSQGRGGLEIKTADRSQAKLWRDDELPDAYFYQVQHAMAATGWPFFYVFCLLGKKPIIRYVPRNDAAIADLMHAEARFWEMVQANEMPAPSGLDCDDDVLSLLYQGGGEEEVRLDGHDAEMQSLVTIKAEIKGLQEDAAQIAQHLKLAMGNAKRGIGAGYHANWSRFPVNRLDGAALKRDLPEVAKRYTKESQGERFTVAANGKKEKGENNED